MAATAVKGKDHFKGEVEVAVKALYKYCNQQTDTQSDSKKKDLFVENPFEYVWLVVATKKRINPQPLPTKIPIPHSFRTSDCMNNDVCLITQSPSSQITKLLEEKGVKGITKVVDVAQLRSTYKQFEAKRLLCASYDLFLADSQCISTLPVLLGKKFALKKKLPLPVDLSADNLAEEIEQAMNCTSLVIPPASNISIRASTTLLQPSESVSNVLAVIDSVIRLIPGGLENIQSVNLKVSTSPAFPIYCCLE